jgi:hypothetical protein
VRARWADLSRSQTYGIGKRLREEIADLSKSEFSGNREAQV